MEIRVMTAEDAEQYQALRREALTTQPLAFGSDIESFSKKTLDDIREQLTRKPDGGFTFGAWVDGELVGTVALWRPSEPKFQHGAFLVAMYVTDRVRGQGCGRKLVEALIEEARRLEGLHKITLTVSTCQESAVRLYQACGFEEWGREKMALHHEGTYTEFAHMTYWLDQPA